MSHAPEIAIVGGGPGGLTLARVLSLHGLSATVFEADISPFVRPQGGSLDMHPDTGQRALQLSGLDDAFKSFARYEDQGGKAYRADGQLLFADANQNGNRPEIDRSHLRQLFLDALPVGTMRWGQKVNGITRLADGRYAIDASEGRSEPFDLVVGADGAWSRVRPFVSDVVPAYEGVVVADLGIDDVDVRHPEISALIGRGKMFAKGSARLLVGQRSANAHIRVYAAIRTPLDALSLDMKKPDEAKQTLLNCFKDFSPELLDLIGSGTLLAVRPLYAMPIGHRWNNRPGITLIGDAAHLMSPFGGEGANGAMADGADLGIALSQGGDWRQAVEKFEAMMFSRAATAAQGAADGLLGAVAEDAPEHVREHFESARSRVLSDAPRPPGTIRVK